MDRFEEEFAGQTVAEINAHRVEQSTLYHASLRSHAQALVDSGAYTETESPQVPPEIEAFDRQGKVHVESFFTKHDSGPPTYKWVAFKLDTAPPEAKEIGSKLAFLVVRAKQMGVSSKTQSGVSSSQGN